MVSPSERRLENSEYKKNFYVDGQKLFCEFCQHVVDHTKKSTLDSHLKSEKHKNNVNRSENLKLSRQTTLDTTNNLNERERINIALVKEFTKANIPLEKVDKLKKFFLEYCRNGGAIVGSDQLRNRYLVKVYDSEVLKLQNLLQGKRISVTIDETTDMCSKSVVNILFSFNDQTVLAKTEFITVVNSTSIAQLVMKVLQFYHIPFENLIFFISDNAAYMLKAFEILLSLIPQLIHNRCLAHILNLVGETWVHYKSFQFFSNIVKNIKMSFVQCLARKRRWVSFVKSFSNTSTNQIILPPLPVKTRWNSWFKFVFWINQNVIQLYEFYLNEEQISNENQAIQELVAVFRNDTNKFIFEIISMFISYNAIRLVEDLEFFEIRNKPFAPFVASRLSYLEALLQSGIINPPISEEMRSKFDDNQVNPEIYAAMFHEANQLALNKLKKHVDKHPALPLFKAIQCFNPRFIRIQQNRQNIYLYSEIQEFKLPTNQIIQEWGIYCELDEDFSNNEEFDLDLYWREKSQNLPNLSKLALDYIWLPISGVDVERSFSTYKNILDDKRTSLSETSIAALNFMYFNSDKIN